MAMRPFPDLVMTTRFFHSADIAELEDALSCDHRHVGAVPADGGKTVPRPVPSLHHRAGSAYAPVRQAGGPES